MKCPHCESTAVTRWAKYVPGLYRKPRAINGTIYRVHRCLTCERLFLSEQTAVSKARSEEIEELMLPPMDSFELTPNDLESASMSSSVGSESS